MSERVNVESVEQGADHLSRNPDVAPKKGQPFTALGEMLAEQTADAEPEVAPQPAKLEFVGNDQWRFRTVPGRAGAVIALRIPIESDDTDTSVLRKNKYKRWLDRQIKQGRIDRNAVGKDGLLKTDKAVFDILGEYHLAFRPVRVKGKRIKEAEYVTDEAVVAAYIRERLQAGEFAGEIYEEVRPMAVEINGQRIYVQPADDTARLAMAAAAAGD